MGIEVACLLLLTYVTEISGDVVIVQPKNKTLTVSEGSDLDLHCQHPSNDVVVWYVSGYLIQNSTHDPTRYVITETTSKDGDYVISHLTVNNIELLEGGFYKCSNNDTFLSLFDEAQWDSVQVKVIKSNAVVGIEGPVGGTVTPGADLLLICTGEATSELAWLYEGKVLAADAYGQIVLTSEVVWETGRRRLALTRHRVTAEHSGQYSCYDRNNKVKKTVQIDVVRSGDVVIIQPKTKNLTVSEGSDLDLDCQHSPNDAVVWYVSGFRIQDTTHDPTRYVITETRSKQGDYVVSHLTVKNISRLEGGVYKCSNNDTFLTLFDENQSDAVQVHVTRSNAVVEVEGPPDRIVSAGTDLLLICSGELTSDLTWLFEGNVLELDAQGQITITPDVNWQVGRRRLALTRRRVTAKDGGLYNCYDRYNRVRKSIRIDVIQSGTGSGVDASIALMSVTLLTATFVLAAHV